MNVTRATFDDVMVPNYNPAGMVPVRGEGSRVWDQDGAEYIDFAGGIAVNFLGHCHPELVCALKEQADKLWHLSNVWTNEPALRLADKLVSSTFADKVYFANSGAEANEAALKLARRWALDKHGEEKNQIIAFNKGFHGRTFFTVTVGGQAAYSDGFGPKPAAVDHCDYNDLAAFEALISDNTCAVMMEPLQGEGGIISPTNEFIKGVRALCDKHNALLIFDEVQTGFGRTGEMFGATKVNVEPDMVTLAKGIGGGFPLAAVVGKSKIMDSVHDAGIGSTFGASPISCAAALGVLDVFDKDNLLQKVNKQELIMEKSLETMKENFEFVGDVRGYGIMKGVEIVENKENKTASKELATKIISNSKKNGLLLVNCGKEGNVIRFMGPLTTPLNQVREAMEMFNNALEKI